MSGPATRRIVRVQESTNVVKAVMTMGQTERAEAPFLSDLQPSQYPTSEQIVAAVETALRRLGSVGCAAAAAAEYGEHPDTAPARMRWALAVLTPDLVAVG